ncbi:MAG: hypothetical protein RR053_06400 [Evtepia sp.]
MERKEKIENIIEKLRDDLSKRNDVECGKKVDRLYSESTGYKKGCCEFSDLLMKNLEELEESN